MAEILQNTSVRARTHSCSVVREDLVAGTAQAAGADDGSFLPSLPLAFCHDCEWLIETRQHDGNTLVALTSIGADRTDAIRLAVHVFTSFLVAIA